MKIGINLLFLLPGETGGIQTHAVALVEALGRLDREHEYFLFLNEESRDLPLELPANFHRVPCAFCARRRAVRYAWEQFLLPAQAIARGLDMVHSMAYVGPVLAPGLSLVTTHDVNFLAWGRSMGALRRLTLGTICFAMAHRADTVLTVSHFAAQEIATRLRVNRRRIVVVANAADAADADDGATGGNNVVLPYFAAFAGGDENKNIARLIDAFVLAADRVPHRLVLLGRLAPRLAEQVARAPASVQARIEATGFLCRTELRRRLRGAAFLVFPSFYEGFGLPILEAQREGVAVACANSSSLPEVAGDSALLFDPHSTEDIAAKIEQLASDRTLQATLQDRGTRNVERYSWAASARRLYHVYLELLRPAASPQI
ncbi:MAG: glycosyltransferase family 4 protein [Opitutae bacterium]|nr:glycosyltransferase family 4 protein [Opitutae bacterium]